MGRNKKCKLCLLGGGLYILILDNIVAFFLKTKENVRCIGDYKSILSSSLRLVGTTSWVATGGGALCSGPMSEKINLDKNNELE